jgi:hypothetical protein
MKPNTIQASEHNSFGLNEGGCTIKLDRQIIGSRFSYRVDRGKREPNVTTLASSEAVKQKTLPTVIGVSFVCICSSDTSKCHSPMIEVYLCHRSKYGVSQNLVQ